MSESNGPNGEDKKTRTRRRSKHDRVLTPTVTASRHATNSRGDDRHQPGSAMLQRQCACGTHTIGGGECHTCQRQGTTVNEGSHNALPTELSQGQTFPTSGLAYDFSQVPVHSSGAIQNAEARAVQRILTEGGPSELESGRGNISVVQRQDNGDCCPQHANQLNNHAGQLGAYKLALQGFANRLDNDEGIMNKLDNRIKKNTQFINNHISSDGH